MKNFWVQREDVCAVWYADVTALLDTPETLLSLLLRVYQAASETRLVLPAESDPAADMSRRWETERTIASFQLSHLRVEADLAWYADDRLVEGRVADLGALLESLQPTPNSIHLDNRVPGSPPVQLKGGRVSYVGNTPSPRPPFGEQFSITLRSDIWLPYVLGRAHPNCDYERYFDNRVLAARNAPRLNGLLGIINRLVTEAGGRFALDRGEMNALYAQWLSDEGIALDGPQPALMPPSEVDVDWPAFED